MTRMVASKISDVDYENLVNAVRTEGNNVSAFIRDLIVNALHKEISKFHNLLPPNSSFPLYDFEFSYSLDFPRIRPSN